MTSIAQIGTAAGAQGLMVSGAFHPVPEDDLAGAGTVFLLSPDEPTFWSVFSASPEAQDGRSDPLDRWSTRTIGAIAKANAAQALFPFGGPPWRAFVDWARRSGRAHGSPVGLLVHDEAGLFISYRGAIALAEVIPLPPPMASPCGPCHRPCLSACPVDAFAAGSYDVAACKAHLRRPSGQDCRANGCLVRRACPVGAGRRLAAQSAFHMEAFDPL